MSLSVIGEGDGALTIRVALLKLFRLAVPTAVSFCSTTLSNTAAFAFVGRNTDEDTQAAHALGFSIGNILVLMVGLGLINGMDTLCPLAIGSGHPEDTFVHLIQAFSIVVAVMIPLTPLIIFCEPLLILCKQAPVIAASASRYLQASLPAFFLICIYECLRKFLIYHQSILLQTIVSLCAIPIQILFLWIFVAVLSMQALGAGIARSLTWTAMSTTLFILTFLRREQFGWSKFMNTRRPFDREVGGTGPNERNREEIEVQHTATTAAEGQDVQPIEDVCVLNQQVVGGESIMTLTTSGMIEVKASNGINQQTEENNSINIKTDEDLKMTNNTERVEIVPFHCPLQISQIDNCNQQQLRFDHWWKGIPEFLKIAIPSTFLCVFEWLSFEAQIFEASYLGSVEIAALSTSQSLGTLIYFVSLSVSVTVNSQVGRYMGQLHPLDGHTVTRVRLYCVDACITIFLGVLQLQAGILASFCISFPIALIVALSRYRIAEWFSSSAMIQQALRQNLLVLALGVVLADSLHSIMGGAIKALYMQWRASVFDLIGLLGLMQAIGLTLAYGTSMEGQGFVIGTAIGVLFVDVCYFIMLFRCINWSKRAKCLASRQLRSKSTASFSQR